MNEEIQVTMGLNTSGFRTELEKSKQAAATFGNGMKSIGQSIGGFIGLAALGMGINKLTEFAEQIKRTSEITGLSTDKVQGINYAMRQTGGDAETATTAIEKLNLKIGQAKDGNKEAAATFDNLGVSLGDVDTVLGEIADKVKNAKDESERARIAFEAFGKSGQQMIPILMGGAKGLEDWTKKAPKISEKEIQDIERFNHALKDTGDNFMILAGKALGAVGDVSYFLGKLVFSGFSPKKMGQMDAQDTRDAWAASDAKKFREQMTALNNYNQAVEAQKQIRKEQEESEQTGEAKIYTMRDKARTLEMDIAAIKEDSVDKVKKQIELDKIQFQIKHEIAEQDRKYHEETEQAQNRQLAMQNEINNAAMAKRDAANRLQEAKDRPTQYTIEELAGYANQNRWASNATTRKDQMLAQKIKAEEDDLQNSGVRFDNPERAKAEEKDIERLRGQLSNNVPESERFPFKSLQEAAQKTSDNLQELLDKAKNEGLNIKPVMAP